MGEKHTIGKKMPEHNNIKNYKFSFRVFKSSSVVIKNSISWN